MVPIGILIYYIDFQFLGKQNMKMTSLMILSGKINLARRTRELHTGHPVYVLFIRCISYRVLISHRW